MIQPAHTCAGTPARRETARKGGAGRRAWLPAIAVVLSAALISSCQRGDSTTAGRKFAVTYQTLNNPFFKDLDDGLRDIIEARGDQLSFFDAQFRSKEQVDQISTLLHGGYSGIFINPVDWKGIGKSLSDAKKTGIPVVIIDAPVQDQSLVVTTVASDNYKAGVLAGEALILARPQGARIVALTLPKNKACRDRIRGFKESIAKIAGLEIISEQGLEEGTTEAAYPKMKDLLVRDSDIDAVFAINDPQAFGAIRALEQAEKKNVVVVAVDGSRQAVEAIRAGRLLGTSAQFPREIGREAAKAMYDHIEGREVPPEISVRVEFVNAENAENFGKSDAGS